MFHVHGGDDFGWPYCYFDPEQKKKVLAPEYSGDGKLVGRCETKKGNVAYFPAHWAPDGLLFYTGKMFPGRDREGAFIARRPRSRPGWRTLHHRRHGRTDLEGGDTVVRPLPPVPCPVFLSSTSHSSRIHVCFRSSSAPARCRRFHLARLHRAHHAPQRRTRADDSRGRAHGNDLQPDDLRESARGRKRVR